MGNYGLQSLDLSSLLGTSLTGVFPGLERQVNDSDLPDVQTIARLLQEQCNHIHPVLHNPDVFYIAELTRSTSALTLAASIHRPYQRRCVTRSWPINFAAVR